MAKSFRVLALALFMGAGSFVALELQPSHASADLGPELESQSQFRSVLDGNLTIDGTGASKMNYERLAGDRTALDRALSAIAKTDPSTLASSKARLAFWLNTYNLMMVDGVLSDWGGKKSFSVSARDFAIFDKARHVVGGHKLSLNEIEHVVLRGDLSRFSRGQGDKAWISAQHKAVWEGGKVDPRIHMALNCASVGCPSLAAIPFSAQNLDSQLNKLSANYANDALHGAGPNGLSEIFKWYGDDFGGPDGVKAFISKYRKSDGDVVYGGWINYDWSLNTVK